MANPASIDSILLSTATGAGISEDYLADDTSFKNEAITAINATLNKFNQIGIGVMDFHIADATATWDQFFGDTTPQSKQWFAREYAKHALKKSFDPPNSSMLQSQLDDQMRELEFRLLVDQDD